MHGEIDPADGQKEKKKKTPFHPLPHYIRERERQAKQIGFQ
jgi:hypothetical protein